MHLLKLRWLYLPVLCTIVTALIFAQGSNNSVQSWPPDTTGYSRVALPDDQGYVYDETEGVVRDVVVSNTDPNLKNTDTFNDGETSIAIDPENPNHIVISWEAIAAERSRTADYSGNLNARNSPEYAPPLTATRMYCLPSTIYVIGDPLCCAGIQTAPTCSPVFLS